MAAFLVFIVLYSWTISQFLSYYFAASFLQQMHQYFTAAKVQYIPFFQFSLLLTFIQLLNSFIDYSEKNKRREPIGFLVLETLGNMAHNYSMTFLQVPSVFAIKMIQPVANMIFRRTAPERNSSAETNIGLPFIFLGVISFIVEEHRIRVKRVGVALAVASIFISRALTVFRKILHEEDDKKSSLNLISISVWYLWQISSAVCLWMLEMWKVLPGNSASIAGTFFAFGFFHFVSQHMSTFIVLKVIGPLNLLYVSLARKVVVLLLLVCTRAQPLTVTSVLAVFLASSGMFINLLGKVEKLSPSLPIDTMSGVGKKTAKLFRISLFFFTFTSLAMVLVLSSQYRSLVHKQAETSEFEKKAGSLSLDKAQILSLSSADPADATDARAKTLVDNSELVGESKRILLTIFESLLRQTQHVVFLSYAEDVEGAAETAGAIYLLQSLNKKVHFYCPLLKCTKEGSVGRTFFQNRAKNDVALIVQGGRTFFESVGDRDLDALPFHLFLTHLVLFLPISFSSLSNLSAHSWSTTYASRFNKTQIYMLLSDRYSLRESRKYFKSFNSILAPSAAFGIGVVSRSMRPAYDVLLLRSAEPKSTNFRSSFPTVQFYISDWKIVRVTNSVATEGETAALVAQAALQFLQRGKVVLTDKLEAHVLCVLLNIPQVYMEDPKDNSSLQFHSSWTASLKSVLRIDINDDERVKHAVNLLNNLNS